MTYQFAHMGSRIVGPVAVIIPLLLVVTNACWQSHQRPANQESVDGGAGVDGGSNGECAVGYVLRGDRSCVPILTGLTLTSGTLRALG
jgi:hypothetical protein